MESTNTIELDESDESGTFFTCTHWLSITIRRRQKVGMDTMGLAPHTPSISFLTLNRGRSFNLTRRSYDVVYCIPPPTTDPLLKPPLFVENLPRLPSCLSFYDKTLSAIPPTLKVT